MHEAWDDHKQSASNTKDDLAGTLQEAKINTDKARTRNARSVAPINLVPQQPPNHTKHMIASPNGLAPTWRGGHRTPAPHTDSTEA